MWKSTARVESFCAVEGLQRKRQLAAADAGALEEAGAEEAAVEEVVLALAAGVVLAPAALLGADAATPPALASRESVR